MEWTQTATTQNGVILHGPVIDLPFCPSAGMVIDLLMVRQVYWDTNEDAGVILYWMPDEREATQLIEDGLWEPVDETGKDING